MDKKIDVKKIINSRWEKEPDGSIRMGMPLMFQVRPDVQTPEQRARLLYAWLQIGEEHMPEVSIINACYQGNNDRPDFVLGSDAYAAGYSWKNIPPFEEFKKKLFDNKEIATCIAAVDSTDQERVGLLDWKGQIALAV